jgi:hypothetical protein
VSAPRLEAGDCIHIALPVPENGNPLTMGAAISRAYERLGVRVFMIDYLTALDAPVIVSVVQGVPPEIRFDGPPKEFTR